MKSTAEATLAFEEGVSLVTLSGANGAGKSTLIRAAWLAQKAHFVQQLQNEAVLEAFQHEVSRYLGKDDSRIELTFTAPGADGEGIVEAAIAVARSRESGFEISYVREDLINRSWNVQLPQDLILFVDASKGFSEDTLTHDQLSIARNDKALVALEAILNPETLFSGIYRQLVRDYVHQRLVPSTPDRGLYFNIAKAMFGSLLADVEVSNFSGNRRDEFVLLGRSLRNGKKVQLYDVREFSSGEKALLSTLTFLSLARSVAVLAIDEPENHFHDSLLLEFVALVRDLATGDGIVAWVENYNKGKGSSALKIDHVRKMYGGHRLQLVILATHSRPLIYKTFSIGINYSVVNGQVDPIPYEGAEQTLRTLGLSTTISRLVLVEGDTDSGPLNFLLADRNCQVKPLNGSDAVMETFKRLAKISEHLTDSQFVFLVDSDNKPADFFEQLRETAPDFYEQAFLKLSVHEFENLLLDAALFTSVLNSFIDLTGKPKVAEKDVEARLVAHARDALPATLAKELANGLRLTVLSQFGPALWNGLAKEVDPAAAVTARLTAALGVTQVAALESELRNQVATLSAGLTGLTDAEVLDRCDGKRVFNVACGDLCVDAAIPKKTFVDAILKSCREAPSPRLKAVVDEIGRRLDA